MSDIRVLSAEANRAGPKWDVIDTRYPARVIASFYVEDDAQKFAEWWSAQAVHRAYCNWCGGAFPGGHKCGRNKPAPDPS